MDNAQTQSLPLQAPPVLTKPFYKRLFTPLIVTMLALVPILSMAPYTNPLTAPTNPLFLPMGLFFYLAAVHVHLAGHAVANALVGFRFWFWIAGPIRIWRDLDGLTISLNKNWNDYGGKTSSTPASETHLAVRLAISALAGLGVSILLVISLLIAWFTARSETSQLHSYEGALSLAFIISSYIVVREILGSDSGIIRALWRQPATRGNWLLAMSQLDHANATGQRPRDWKPELIERIVSLNDSSPADAGAHHYAYLHALDTGRPDLAARHLKQARQILGSWQPKQLHTCLWTMPILRSIYLEEIFFNVLYHRRDDPAWTIQITDLSYKEHSEVTRLRAEAAVALVQRDWESAKARAAQGVALTTKRPVVTPGFMAVERDWLTDLSLLAENPELWPDPLSETQPSMSAQNSESTSPAAVGTPMARPAEPNEPASADTPQTQVSSERRWNLLALTLMWVFSIPLLGFVLGMSPAFWNLFLIPSMALATLIFALTIREVGRSVTGLLVGFRLVRISSGPFEIKFQPRIRLRLNQAWRGYFGQSVSIPTTLDDLPRRTAVYVASGPITWVVAGMAFLLILLAHGVVFTTTETHLLPDGVWVTLSIISLLMFAFAIVSFLFDDGPWLFRIFMGSTRGTRWVALRSLTAFDRAGYRPSKWPSSLISQAQVHQDNSRDELAAQRFAYFAALDSGDRNQAHEHLDRMLQVAWKQPQAQQADYKTEAAFFEAFVNDNTTTARAYLSQAGTVTRRHAWHRANAAVFLSEGDIQGALNSVAQAFVALGKSSEPGIGVAEAEWLRQLQAAAEQEQERTRMPVTHHDPPPEPQEVEITPPSPRIPRLRKIEL